MSSPIDNLQERPDPVDSRDEFVLRIKNANCWTEHFPANEILGALLEQDAVKIQEMKDVKAGCQANIDKYIADYDNAKDRAEKVQVVGGVKRYERPV